jgi:hypothetical protein
MFKDEYGFIFLSMKIHFVFISKWYDHKYTQQLDVFLMSGGINIDDTVTR